MGSTTISISTEIRDKIREFGYKGESYNDILERLYQSASKRLLQDVLMDNKDCFSLDEARKMIKE